MQSFVAIPLFAIASPIAGVQALPSPTAVLSQSAIESSAITPQEEEIRTQRAKEIDEFLESRNSPLAGYGRKFVDEAADHDIDWRLLVAIAGRESTFGQHACKGATNSFLGYGSCHINFKSVDEAIETVSRSLGGHTTKTKGHYQEDMSTAQILNKYNTVIPGYTKQVIRIMKMIDADEEIA